MDFITKVTQKGQITLPKHIRVKLNLTNRDKVVISIKNNVVSVKPAKKVKDFLDLAGTLPVVKGKDALKAREYMETHYLDAIV